jgi:protein AIR1/2
MKKISNIERYCYNCARKGHFGDDCPRPRPYYIQGGRIALVVSAFGEGNVPEWAKLKPEQIGKRKASPIDDEEDGWFENQAREPPKPVKKVGGIKLNKNEKRDAPANSADSRRSNNNSNRQPPPSSRPLAERLSSPRRGPPPRDRSPIRPKDRDQQSTIDSYRPSYRPRPEYRTRDDIRNEREWEYEASRWRQRRDEDRGGSRRRDHRR